MTDKLPPNLLTLFTARPALRYLPPCDYAPEERTTSKISGVAQFVEQMKDYENIPYEPTESWLQRKEGIKAEKRKRLESLRNHIDEKFAPVQDPNIKGDAMKTLFIARLSYETKEADLEREFGRFGPIERIRIITDTHPGEGDSKKSKKKVKPNRGYAFVVYEREKDMKAAYKETDGIRIKDRRALVDVERGRVVVGWRPRRLGGGLGGRGYTKTTPARPLGPGFGAPPPGGPGGFRGSFRGGFDRGGFRGGFRSGDRGGYGGGRSGGLGYQGGGSFGGGGRGGYSGSGSGGYGGVAPPNAPSGPGGGPRPAYGPLGGFGPQNGSMNGAPGPSPAPAPVGPEPMHGGYDPRRNGGYDDRGGAYRGSPQSGSRGYGPLDGGRPGGFTGGNREPVRIKDERASYVDDRRDRGYAIRPREDEYPRKRYHEGDAYEDPRAKRRY